MARLKRKAATTVMFTFVILTIFASPMLAARTPTDTISGAGEEAIISSRKIPTLKNLIASEDKRPILTGLPQTNVPFIANKGQVNDSVVYYAHTFAGMVFVTREGAIVYSLPQFIPQNRGAGELPYAVDHVGHGSKMVSDGGVVLRETLVGALPTEVEGHGQSESAINYLKGKDRSKWKSGVATYDGVSLGEVYDGIEVVLKARGNNVEKLFHIRPGADYSRIRIALEGADKIQINDNGELLARTGKGLVRFTSPIAFQEIETDGGIERKAVEVAYMIGSGHYGFKVGAYDTKRELIIDPLLASTLLGGTEMDLGYALAFDSSGRAFISGSTYSADFPTTSGVYDNSLGGDQDIFVATLSSDLNTLISATFLGGSDQDRCMAVTFDSNDNLYLTGWTGSSDFPSTTGVYDQSLNGGRDIFVAALSNDLTTLYSATYLGGSSDDYSSQSIKLDSSGNVYLTGGSASLDFPVTSGAYDQISDAGGGTSDGIVAVLSKDLSALLAATFLGDSRGDAGRAIALDSNRNIFVSGVTESNDFPTTSGAFDESHNGDRDVFVASFSNDLSTLNASTFFGGSDFEVNVSIYIDADDRIYVAGYTGSTDFPTTRGAYEESYNGGSRDVFAAVFTNDLTTLFASSLLGGSDNDTCLSSTLDSFGNVYLTGYTRSNDFPVTGGAYAETLSGGSDVFAAALSKDLGVLHYSTYLGGALDENGYSLSIDDFGSIFLAGYTFSADFPTSSGAYNEVHSGDRDLFVANLSMKPDQFICYKSKPTKKTPKFSQLAVTLDDLFENKDFDVKKLKSLCNPAHLSQDIISDMYSHLVSYQIKKAKGEEKHEKQNDVKITNWFGSLLVDTQKSVSLMVPSAMDQSTPVAPLDPEQINHYKCYSVKVNKKLCWNDPTQKCGSDADCLGSFCNQGFPKGGQIFTADQFGQDKWFDVKKPTKFCTPVDKNGEGIIDSSTHLMCYQIKQAKGEPKHSKVNGIYINNQFGPDQLDPGEYWQIDTVKEEELCLPFSME